MEARIAVLPIDRFFVLLPLFMIDWEVPIDYTVS